MHQITVVFGPSPVPWAFLFNKPELADQAFATIKAAKLDGKDSLTGGSCISIVDEFGQQGCLEIKNIHGFMLEDLDKSNLAQIERGLHQARTQAKAQQRAGADPALRAAMMTQGAPVLSPMGNGRFS